jgi:hypothetical protein
LAADKKEKKELIKALKHEEKPYPKSTRDFNKEVQTIITISPEDELANKFW